MVDRKPRHAWVHTSVPDAAIVDALRALRDGPRRRDLDLPAHLDERVQGLTQALRQPGVAPASGTSSTR